MPARAPPSFTLPHGSTMERFDLGVVEVVAAKVKAGTLKIKPDRYIFGFAEEQIDAIHSLNRAPKVRVALKPDGFSVVPAGMLLDTEILHDYKTLMLLVDAGVVTAQAIGILDLSVTAPVFVSSIRSPTAWRSAFLLEHIARTDIRGYWRLLVGPLVSGIVMAYLRHLRNEPLAAEAPYRAGLTEDRLSRVIKHIHKNYSQPISLSRLAGVSVLSVYHFSRAFRKSMGVSPMRYVWQHRIDCARTMIRRYPDMPLIEIALACGFTSASHFTEVFRREIGTSPSRYRAELHKNADFRTRPRPSN